MKHLLTTTALAAVLAAGPALTSSAQDTANPMANEPAAQEQPAEPVWTEYQGEILTEDLIGAEVYNSADESLGEISNLVLSVGFGAAEPAPGEMINEPDAAAPQASNEAVEPEEQAASDTGESAQVEPAPAEGTEPLPDESGQAAQTETAPEAGAGAQDLAEGTEPAPDQSGQAGDTGSQDLAESTEPAPDQSQAGDTGGQMAAGEATPPAPPAGETVMEPSGQEAMTASIESAVIGVGGFLGIGQKDVAVSIEDLEFFTDGEGNYKIVLDMSPEELEAAPQYAAPGDEAAGAAPAGSNGTEPTY